MTTQTVTLAAQLLSWFDEDEAVARAAVRFIDAHDDEPSDDGRLWHTDPVSADPVVSLAESGIALVVPAAFLWEPEAVLAHIARHDPARVLADLSAKRRIVEDFQDSQAEVEGGNDAYIPRRNVLHDVLRALTAPYADRPEFREEWR